MSAPSDVAPKPTTSPRMVAPRACACSRLSSTTAPPPPDEHEAVPAGVVGARGPLRRGIPGARHGAHGIEQQRHPPAQFLAAAGEHHVLQAEGDLLRGGADAVRRCAAGRRDRVVDAADAEMGGQAGRDGGAHAARHLVGSDARGCRAARSVSAASIWFAGEPPPEPMMRPVRGCETCCGVRPASAIASVSATCA